MNIRTVWLALSLLSACSSREAERQHDDPSHDAGQMEIDASTQLDAFVARDGSLAGDAFVALDASANADASVNADASSARDASADASSGMDASALRDAGADAATPHLSAFGSRIGVGLGHSCAVLDSGTVKCWGDNANAQLGAGDRVSRGDDAHEMGGALPVVSLGTDRTAKYIAVGGSHACALLDDDRVKCWGSNNAGQLGLGDTNNRGDSSLEMGDDLPYVSLASDRHAVQLVAGAAHTCALLDDGSVQCWGYNMYGQLGIGSSLTTGDSAGEMGDALPKVNLGSGRHAIQLSAGAAHTCALLDNLSVKCWGFNGTGQLGQVGTSARGDAAGEMGDMLSPVNLGTGRSAYAIATGDFHTCAILDDATLKCWGFNASGQLGLGDTSSRGTLSTEMGDALPVVNLGTSRFPVDLSIGMGHSCAALDNGSFKCWGANGYGQLCIGSTSVRGDELGEMGDSLSPISFSDSAHVTDFAANAHHTCAWLSTGKLKCWGANDTGQLGMGDSNARGDQSEEIGSGLLDVDLGS